jgi:hypothetical protein
LFLNSDPNPTWKIHNTRLSSELFRQKSSSKTSLEREFQAAKEPLPSPDPRAVGVMVAPQGAKNLTAVWATEVDHTFEHIPKTELRYL